MNISTSGVARRTLRAVGAVTAGALLALSAGCNGLSSTGPGAAAPATQRAERAPVNHDAYATLGYRITWRGFPVMSRGGRIIDFEVFDDVIVVQESGTTVTLMEEATGRNRWSTPLGQRLTRFFGTVRVGERILCSSDNELFVLGIDTGELLDRQNLALVVNNKPVIIGSVAIFGTSRGEVLGHNLATGYRHWGYMLDGAIESRPTIVNGLVGAVSRRGDMIIIDPASGSSRARDQIFGGLDNNPVGDEEGMYVAGLDQSIYCLSPVSGRISWRHRAEAPITAQPVIHDGTLYIEIPGEGLTALDGATGDHLWSSPDVRGRVVGISDGRIITWDGSHATLLDMDRGDVLERVRLPGIERIIVAPFENGDMYTATRDGVIAKLSPRR